MERVAIIFDHITRPETTGLYCFRALNELTNAEQFHPDELEAIPRHGFELYLFVDDGMAYDLPSDLRPQALWAIDTHVDLPRISAKARGADLVFAAQRDGCQTLKQAGIDRCQWLPLACDPEIHRKYAVNKELDVCFVGNLVGRQRKQLVNLLQGHFPKMYVGRQYFEEMARLYSATRVVFNRSIASDINMRVFEAMSCGSLLLTNDLSDNGQQELFQDGVHLATYREPEELLDKLRFYLAHDVARERIAANGRQHVLDKHTYRHRMQQLLTGARASKHRPTFSPSAMSEQSPDPTYYGHVRPELLKLIPSAAGVVIDVGCGTGRLGEALKRRQACTVYGLEKCAAAGRIARNVLDQVWIGDAEEIEPEIPESSCDVLVCGDVLEHLRDPAAFLRRAMSWLSPQGIVVASIPNARHHTVVRSLLAGNWTYESAGLLDRTHLRFFTRREIEKLFFRCGYDVQQLSAINGPGDSGQEWTPDAGTVRLGRLQFSGLSPCDAAEFSAYQYLVVARPATGNRGDCRKLTLGRTSIILVTHNELQYTRLCLESIRQRTDEPYEIVVVDNGSTDGTVEYLRTADDVRLIENGENHGFPRAANQGIRASRGEQILLLNNDCVVTTGWLRRMLWALQSDLRIGLVGPCSNCVSGVQQVEVDYDDLAQLDGFAWDWGKDHHRQQVETQRLVGFCLLVWRQLIDSVGLLDERFGIGNFEDDDYCRRALQAGFRAVVAEDAFVHHFGGRTFRSTGIDFSALMQTNRQLYEEKWQTSQPVVGRAAIPGGSRAESTTSCACLARDSGGLQLLRNQPKLSVCMIVRDSSRTLPAALESIRPWVDEIVAVDTGSRDDTPEIVRRFGGRLFHFPWCDDFAAARNESLRHARGEWLFWMDSDDTISADNGRKLREIAQRPTDPRVLAFVVQVHCPHADNQDDDDVTVVDHVKLIRNLPTLRFTGRIHEQILSAVRDAGGDVEWTDIFVTHSGADRSPEGEAKKLARDLRLLEMEQAEQPDHPFTLFNLGMTYSELGRFADAVKCLARSLAVAGPHESHRRKAHALLIHACMQMDEHDRARRLSEAALREYPDDPELLFRAGVLAQHAGQLRQAKDHYLAAMHPNPSCVFRSFDRGISGYKARHNLANVYAGLGDLAQAEEQWRAIVAAKPNYRQGWRGLIRNLLQQSRTREAQELVESKMADPNQRASAMVLMSEILQHGRDFSGAKSLLQSARRQFPDDLDLLECQCKYLFEHDHAAEAREALRQLVARSPHDAAARHNLGVTCLKLGLLVEAKDELAKATCLRPSHGPTFLHLSAVLERLGQRREAIAALRTACDGPPEDPCTRAAQEKLASITKAKTVLTGAAVP